MTALYRRYRPETFQEVIGQSHVTDPLRHALVADRANHAYLFSGPRGCGKTTSARILARCLNCAEGPTDTPCGVCPSCVELSRDGGGSLDVVEIDAASHNGVDDARELRERAVFAPARDRFKIYILDEAHMVTQQGFNALLKIVEEPRPHVKFIFATTEPEKVLTTIRSRTHHYPFRLVPPGELLNYLESLVDSEGISVEEGVLALVVRSGGGSVRDSLSLFDQLIAGSTENNISLTSAQALLGYTPRAVLDEVLSGIASTDAGAVFNAIDRMIHTGQDPRRFVEDLLSHLRDVIVVQATAGDASALFLGVSSSDLDTWRQQSQWFSPQALSHMAERVNHALTEMSGVTSPKLQLELLMARLLSAPEHGGEAPPSSTASLSATAETTAPVSPEKKGSPDAPSEASAPESKPTEEASPSAPEPIEPIEPWTLERLELVWPKIIESLALHKRSLWVALSETKPISVEEDVISIGFVRRSDAEILKKPQGPGSPLPNADLLREAILSHTGHRVRFTVGELELADRVPPSTENAEPSWPVVSKPGSETDDEASAGEVEPGAENILPVAEDALEPQESGSTSSVATRGEPVVRQLLGGELVAEEILDSLSGQGESDV